MSCRGGINNKTLRPCAVSGVRWQNDWKGAVPYISWQEFDDHPQDEHGPEDMKDLQHQQQPVEEVEAQEGGVERQGVHPRRVYDPGQ